MAELYAIILGFVPARILERSLAQYEATRQPNLNYRRVLLDQHYPLHKAENKVLIRQICDKYGVEVLDAGRNLGLHEGFNYIMRQLPLKPEDVVIGFDPDSYPISPGWDMALFQVILQGGEIAWTSLCNPRTHNDIVNKGYLIRTVAQQRVWVPHHAIVNSVCAWRVGFLQKAGGLHEPCAFYGHLESAMFLDLKAQKLEWGVLPDWQDNDELRHLHDVELTEYKWAHAHLQTFKGDFEAFLEAGCPLPPGTPRAPKRLP